MTLLRIYLSSAKAKSHMLDTFYSHSELQISFIYLVTIEL